MFIALYLAVLMTALYWVVKVLLPEMSKPVPKVVKPGQSKPRQVMEPGPLDVRMQKMEMLLAEKNKNIAHLQTELKIFYTQVREFDKVKSLLEEEIRRLREQNRIFRSELGLPQVQSQSRPQENSTQLFI